jgi:hypothetical protein
VASLVVTFIHWARAKFLHEGLWLTSTVVAGCIIGMLLPSAMRGVKFQGIPSFYLRYLMLGAILVVVASWQGECVLSLSVCLCVCACVCVCVSVSMCV